jgi:hypothetical protein
MVPSTDIPTDAALVGAVYPLKITVCAVFVGVIVCDGLGVRKLPLASKKLSQHVVVSGEVSDPLISTYDDQVSPAEAGAIPGWMFGSVGDATVPMTICSPVVRLNPVSAGCVTVVPDTVDQKSW